MSAHPRPSSVARVALMTLLTVAIALPVVVAASAVSIPHSFEDGTVASAEAVNANFGALADAVNDNAARIVTLEGSTTALECYTTGWGNFSGCTTYPDAPVPACNPGYVYTGIAHYNQSDSGCGVSASTNARIRARCCRVAP